MSTNTQLPDRIEAGTTVGYTIEHADYPASAGWSMTLYLAGIGAIEAVADADGDAFVIELEAADTRTLKAGTYQWAERVTLGDEVRTARTGTVAVSADIAAAGPGDLQTWEERTLAVVEAALSGQLGDGIAKYQIAGRAVEKIPIAELRALRESLKAAVQRQATGRMGHSVLFTFTGAGFDR